MKTNSKPKILYLDDERENLDGFYFAFMDDYEIFTTNDPDQVQTIITNETIEVVIIDQKMPKVSGIDKIKELKSFFPDITYILITAYASLKDALKAVNEANIFRFISKPWNDKQIRSTLVEAVEYYRIKKQNKSLVEELKLQNDELQKAYQLAEQSNKLKTAFLANLSHEIRTPLNAIVGFTSLMAESELDKEKRQVFSKVVIDNSYGLLNIIDQIVNVSKIETNQVEIMKQSFIVNELLEELYANFKSKESNELSFEKIVPAELLQLELFSDKVQLRQVLTNLLQNAFKFTLTGSIKFGLAIETAKTINQKNTRCKKDLKNGESRIIFFVEDTGLGIHSDYHSEIFEPFRKLSDDRDDVISGIGLGLYYSSKIIQKLDGELFLSSEPGKGSKFSFCFDNITE